MRYHLLTMIAILLLCSGCSAFRAIFDEDPAVTKQKREQAAKRRQEQKYAEDDRDVISALVKGKPRKSTLFVNSSLSAEERAILEQTEAASKRRDPYDEVEEIRRENRKRSDQISDSVFGSGLKDWL